MFLNTNLLHQAPFVDPSSRILLCCCFEEGSRSQQNWNLWQYLILVINLGGKSFEPVAVFTADTMQSCVPPFTQMPRESVRRGMSRDVSLGTVFAWTGLVWWSSSSKACRDFLVDILTMEAPDVFVRFFFLDVWYLRVVASGFCI